MKDVFAWAPLLWTSRVFAITVLGGATLIVLLYLARFLRPRHLRTLLTADLPVFRKVGGEAEVLGQKLSLTAELDQDRNHQLELTVSQVAALEAALHNLSATVALHLQPKGADAISGIDGQGCSGADPRVGGA